MNSASPLTTKLMGTAAFFVVIALSISSYALITEITGISVIISTFSLVAAILVLIYGLSIVLRNSNKNKEIANEFYKKVADGAPGIISVSDTPTGGYVYVNDAAESLIGFTKEELMQGGHDFVISLIHPEDLKALTEQNEKSPFPTDKLAEFEYRVRCKDGNYKWFHSYRTPFRTDKSNGENQTINVSIDITARKLAEEKANNATIELANLNEELEKMVLARTHELENEKIALKSETERNDLVSRATSDVVRDWDLLSHQILWNDNYSKQFGYQQSEIRTDITSWYNRIHIEDKDNVLTQVNSILDSGGSQWTAEYRFLKANGSYANILDRSHILRDENGAAYRMVGCMTDITLTKNALQKAAESELKFRKIFESDMIGMLFSNLDGRFVEANNAFLKMLGYTKEEFERGEINWDELTPKEYHQKNIWALEQLAKNGVCSPYEKEYIKKDGTRLPVLIGCALITDQAAQSVAYVIDLSEKVETEKKKRELLKIIQQQQKEFENILQNAPSLISVRRGPELRYTFANSALKKFTGITDYLGKTIQEVHPELKDEQGLAAEMEVLKTGKPSIGKAYPIKNIKDGSAEPGWFDFIDMPVYDAAGNIDGIASYGFDVTDLVNASNEIKKNEDRFRLMADSMPQMVWTADPEGNVTYYNKIWYDYTGLSYKDRNNIQKRILHPDDAPLSAKRWSEALLNPKEVISESRIRRHDGEYRWHMSRTAPQFDDQGNLIMWVGTITDIHDQKLISDAIKVSENHFRTVSEHTPFMIWQVDQEGMCTYVNKSWLDFTGLNFTESLSRGWLKALHPEDQEAAASEFMQAFAIRAPFSTKFRLKNSQGEYRWVFTQSNPLINENFEGYIGSITDITEQELAQQSTRELMQKKDEFMSIASHELKTPITSMKASLQIAQRMAEKESGNKITPLISTANKQVNKLTGLVNDLLDVTKIQAGKMQFNLTEFNVVDLVTECVNEIQHGNTSHTIIFDCKRDIFVEADKNRLEQVITNFLSNAIKYSPEAASVLVSASSLDGQFKLEITDYGIGIPQDKAMYVFDRFFRVQESSQKFAGLGLGLYISSEIIKRHSGEVGVLSEEGKGSTFWFSLPLISEEKKEATKVTDELLAQLNISKHR